MDVTLRKLDKEEALASTDIAIMSEDGMIITAIGGGDEASFCVSCLTFFQVEVNSDLSKSFVFVVEKDLIGQVFKFKFKDVPPIPFTIK